MSLWHTLLRVGEVASLSNPFTAPIGIAALATDSGVSAARAGSGSGSKAKKDDLNSLALSGSKDLISQGKDLTTEGSDALHPVIQQFMDLLSGDREAVDAAIAPEERSVLDQYDVSRRAIGEFGPRGGGATSTIAQSRFKQAGDITTLRSSVRRDAASSLAEIGSRLTAQGIGAQTGGINGFMNLLQQALESKGQDLQTMGQLGEGLGTILSLFLG